MKNKIDKFALSLGIESEKQAEILCDLDHEDTAIKKVAGLNIYQPTVENVEKFVRKQILEELRLFPKTVRVHIDLIPKSFDTAQNSHIKDASGVITLGLHDAEIKIPFMIDESEMIPFDVIQMGEETAVYSRENLAKVLINIDRVHSGAIANQHSPYEGVEKAVSEITDPGFLGNTLRIQEQAMTSGRGGRNRGEIYVKANSIENLLEKTAKIKPLRDEDFKSVEEILVQKFASEFIDEMEKIADDDTTDLDNHARLVFETIRDLQFVDATTLPNGTRIKFPEKLGNDYNLTAGIVFKDFLSAGDTPFKKEDHSKAIVLTDDCRYAILTTDNKFYCLKDEASDWKLPVRSISDMNPKESYVVIQDNKISSIFTVDEERKRLQQDITDKLKELAPKSFEVRVLRPSRSDFSSYANIAILDGKKFEKASRDNLNAEFVNKVSQEYLPHLINAFPYHFVAVDPGTKVIKLSGLIKDWLVDPKNFAFTGSADGEEKTAAEKGKIELRSKDKQADTFDLLVKFKMQDKVLFGMEKREFKNIHAGKVNGILRAAGLEQTAIATLIQKAKSDNFSVATLPDNATPEKISGGYVENKVGAALNKFKSHPIGKQVIEEGLSEIIGHQLSETAFALGSGGIRALEELSAYASESQALGIKFEKLAQEHNHAGMLNVAKLMVAQHNIDNAIITAYKGNSMAFLKEAAKNVVEIKPELEKIASDLIKLKTMQYIDNKEVISPNVISSAVRTLDRMYKTASVLTK